MLEQGLKEYLGGDATVAKAVGDRIRPLVGAQVDVRPFLLFSVTAAQNTGTMTGKGQFQKANVEIAVFADTYLACASLSKEVRRLLDHVAVDLTTVQIRPSLLDDESDVEQAQQPGTETPVYLRTQTYRLLYRDV